VNADDTKHEDTADAAKRAKAAPPLRLPAPDATFDWSREYLHQDELQPVSDAYPPLSQYCVLVFDKSVVCPAGSVLLGSRLDADIHQNSCRLAFAGRLLCRMDFENAAEREKLRVFKRKERSGVVDRVVDNNSLIGKDLFKKDSDMNRFIGMQVQLSVNGRGRSGPAVRECGAYI